MSLRERGFDPAVSRLVVREIEYKVIKPEFTTGAVIHCRTHPEAEWAHVRSLGIAIDIADLCGDQAVEKTLAGLPKYELVCGERRWRASGELIVANELAPELPLLACEGVLPVVPVAPLPALMPLWPLLPGTP